MFSGQNFRVKIEFQNSISEFATRYGMPVCGSATESATVAGWRCRHRHRLAGRPGWLDRPPVAARVASRGTGHPDTAGHGRTRTRQAGHRKDVAKRRHGCGRI